MSVMDVRRLVRALAVGGLCFLFFGGAIGFVAAGASGSEGSESWTIPMPGPGDRASYRFFEMAADGTPARRGIQAEVAVEWLPGRDAVAPDLTVRAAHVLGVTYRSARYEAAGDVSWDAATGVPLSMGASWSSPYAYPALAIPMVSLGPQPEAEGSLEGRLDAVSPFRALCGMRADLQGRPVQAGDAVMVFGACDADGVARATPFRINGMANVDGRPALHVDEVGGLGQRVHYDPSLPLPVRVEGKFPGFVDHAYAKDRTFALVLEAYRGGGQGPYPGAIGGPLGEAPNLARRPLTPWLLDDSGVPHDFPLSEAFAAALDPGNDWWGESTVQDFLRRHPDAYLGFAWSFHTEDDRGTAYPVWAMTWTDGDATLSKVVERHPNLVVAETEFLPAEYAVSDLDLTWGKDFFPTASRLPGALPDVAQLWEASRPLLAATIGGEPNTYGFMTGCPDKTCLDPVVIVHAGHTWIPAAPLGIDVMAALRDQSSVFGLIGVDAQGAPLLTIFLHGEQRAPFPVLPPSERPPSAAPASSAGSPASALAWAVPPAEAVAGVGIIALLASLAYYFWPAVKGGAVGLFSRIEPERVLDHPSRARLFALIEANPGIHFQDLARRSAFGHGQLDHHVRKLQAAGLVSRVQGAQYACFFARGQVDRRLMAAAPVLRSDGARRLLAAVERRPGASVRDLAPGLGLAVGTVSYHAKRLQDAGLLQSQAGAYHLTPLGQQASLQSGPRVEPAAVSAGA